MEYVLEPKVIQQYKIGDTIHSVTLFAVKYPDGSVDVGLEFSEIRKNGESHNYKITGLQPSKFPNLPFIEEVYKALRIA